MTLKQYRFLDKLHKLSPKMNDEQKYAIHSVSDIEKTTGLSTEDVLTTATELSLLKYVRLGQNSDQAKERNGYIHAVTITYNGVVAKNEYIKNKALSLLRNIIVPALVSIVCSLIVHYFEK